MIATCLSTRSSHLPDHQQGRFAALDQEFPLTESRDYLVLGIGVWETILQLLVEDDQLRPCWCPAGLFDLPAQPIPAGWLCSLEEGVHKGGTDLWTLWVMKCGYPELLADEHHSDRLQEGDGAALAIFRREADRLRGLTKDSQ